MPADSGSGFGLDVGERPDEGLEQRRRRLIRKRDEPDLSEIQVVGRLEERIHGRQHRLHQIVQAVADADRRQDAERGRRHRRLGLGGPDVALSDVGRVGGWCRRGHSLQVIRCGPYTQRGPASSREHAGPRQSAVSAFAPPARMTLYPLTFHPLFKTRPWGGRMLESLYGKPLPRDVRIGESWEISDRPDDESIIANGPLAGTSLRRVMEQHGHAILGGAKAAAGSRFPLLCKILDARDRLSLQVHPPGHLAAELGGEPKTEMWHIADAAPGAELFVGLRPGVTREVFETKIAAGEVADCFHRIPVKRGDTMFLPSGRVHAIGAGLVIFEIQQNSDTTYRVFDWNRPGLDGKLRSCTCRSRSPASTSPTSSQRWRVRPSSKTGTRWRGNQSSATACSMPTSGMREQRRRAGSTSISSG